MIARPLASLSLGEAVHTLGRAREEQRAVGLEALTASDLRFAAAQNSSGLVGSFIRLSNDLYTGTKSQGILPVRRNISGFHEWRDIAGIRWDYELVVTRNLTIRSDSQFDRTRVESLGATRLMRVARGVHPTA